MKRRTGGALGSAALVVMLTLTGCTSTPSSTGASANPDKTTPAATPVATPAATPVSDVNASVQMFVKALDDLGIKHTDPVRVEVAPSIAEAKFELQVDTTVDRFNSVIYVLKDAEMMASEVEIADHIGLLYVASGNALLSVGLNADSAAIARKIAAKVGGVAHCPPTYQCQP